MKKLLFMFATIAMLTACGGNGEKSTSASGSDASDAPKTYSVEYNLGSNGGTNYACFDTFGSSDKIKADLDVQIDGDKVTIKMPFEVKVKGDELKKSLTEGYIDFCVENSSEKGKVKFVLADTDKVDYDAEYKKLKEGDTFKATIVGETTKDVLEKMNNNWGTFTLVL
ncbi:MAG: hypothetical protein IKX63_04830 [Muribaculaceae bacterium]|nr:hypothetical protein [Muribaculaceae bacterium]